MARPTIQAPIAYKILIVGTSSAGKSSLAIHFTYDQYVTGYEPTITDSYRKRVVIDNKEAYIEIVVIGSDDYTAKRDNYFRSADGFLCVFSIIDRQSFLAVNEFRDHILRIKNNNINTSDNVSIVLVGTNAHLDNKRCVSIDEANSLANNWKVPYIETSAKSRDSCDRYFSNILIIS
ncbi:ras-related protein Ral-a-like [Oppia nitens]|uniref:ras-related protein Ral-a-like n=1 Tax=Oppia nitens TaxID=1686743 RepID=UPI0023DBD60A|nr:ras-related protein Ral-a-like [Oppia nitens]